MSRGPDVATQLTRALEAAGPAVVVRRHETTRWASVTFAGARHRLDLEARSTARLDHWLAALPEAEFALRGHLVADLAVVAVDRRTERALVTIEALTVEV